MQTLVCEVLIIYRRDIESIKLTLKSSNDFFLIYFYYYFFNDGLELIFIFGNHGLRPFWLTNYRDWKLKILQK